MSQNELEHLSLSMNQSGLLKRFSAVLAYVFLVSTVLQLILSERASQHELSYLSTLKQSSWPFAQYAILTGLYWYGITMNPQVHSLINAGSLCSYGN